MQKLQQREAEQLKIQQSNIDKQYSKILKSLVMNDEQLKIIISYCLKFYSNDQIVNVNQYAPVNISRLIFPEQLNVIKEEFCKLPESKCRLQHFLIMMLKIMSFPFQKNPYYLIGLKDIFSQIKNRLNDYITYQQFFKYALGQVVNLEQDDQNTQFQVHFQEQKKQDYLLHDSGIVKILYSKDLKYYLALDKIAFSVKIYDQEMKIVHKFTPNKLKHFNKFPMILDFDYSQLSMKLGLCLSDNTLSIIHLGNFLKDSQQQFQSQTLNQLVYNIPQGVIKLYFIQMSNIWLSISQDNKVYIFNVDRLKGSTQEFLQELKVFKDPKEELNISKIMEVVPLSTICIVTGNQILFFDEALAEKKYKKFVHCSSITNLKYCEQRNQFYLCGMEKVITIFKIQRNSGSFKIWTIEFQKTIISLEVFSHFNTILIIDQSHNLSLYDEKSKFCYQTKNFQHIVKKQKKFIDIYKVTKSDFIIYQSYMLNLHQEKVAITKDIQYSIQPTAFFDQLKEELYISVNSQILSFSLLNGEIRKNYTSETSNISKYLDFSLDANFNLFVLDHEFSLFYVFGNQEQLKGQSRKYKKQIQAESFLKMEYVQETKKIYVFCKSSILVVSNHSKNNFTVDSMLILQKFPSIVCVSYSQGQQKFNFMTDDQLIYAVNEKNCNIQNAFKCVFQKRSQQLQETQITNYLYNSYYDVNIILTNNNEVYLFKPNDIEDQLYIDLTQLCPFRQRHLVFTKIAVFCIQKQNEKKDKQALYLLLTNELGHLIQICLDQLQLSKNQHIQSKPLVEASKLSKNKYSLSFSQVSSKIQHISLKKQRIFKPLRSNTLFIKAHDKEIMIMTKIYIQKLMTLTISKNGFIKLYHKEKNLFTIRLPNLIRASWKMEEIQKIKIKKSIEETTKILQNIQQLCQQQKSPTKILRDTRKIKAKQTLKNINLEEPIPIQIERKDIENIVSTQIQYFTQYNERKDNKSLFRTQKMYYHPWRTKKQFIDIYSNSSSIRKYKKEMPKDLIHMRKSLDMFPRKQQINPEKIQLKIIPQLKAYQFEKKLQITESDNNFLEILNQKQQAFQSCFYVKSDRKGATSKIDGFDEIDKQFKKKQIKIATRRPLAFKSSPIKLRNKSMQLKTKKQQLIYTVNFNNRYDPIKSVIDLFEKHNKEVTSTKHGRLIRIPRMNAIKIDSDQY